MFQSLQDFLQSRLNKNDSSNKTNDTNLAAAVLLFEVIRADGKIDQQELDKMRSILRQHLAVAPEAIDELIELAQRNAEQAISLQGFTSQICEHYQHPQRLELVQHLWLIALADNNIDAHERHLVRKISGLLYLTDKEIIIAKEKAKQRLEINADKP